jgi:multiple sugar transport system permease protein
MKARTALGWSLAGAVSALVLAALWAAPLLWALSTALRPEHETVSAHFHWLPQHWTLEAFRRVLAAGHLPRWLFNSLLVALLVTVVTMAISLLAAFVAASCCSRCRCWPSCCRSRRCWCRCSG